MRASGPVYRFKCDILSLKIFQFEISFTASIMKYTFPIKRLYKLNIPGRMTIILFLLKDYMNSIFLDE